MSEAKHTPLPWNCAHAYSSVVGVPIINQKGQRVGNTALPDLPPEWAEMKERAVADAKLIVSSVNSLPDLVKALDECQKALAAIIDPAAIKSTSVMNAFAQATEAECKARSALTAYRSAKP